MQIIKYSIDLYMLRISFIPSTRKTSVNLHYLQDCHNESLETPFLLYVFSICLSAQVLGWILSSEGRDSVNSSTWDCWARLWTPRFTREYNLVSSGLTWNSLSWS